MQPNPQPRDTRPDIVPGTHRRAARRIDCAGPGISLPQPEYRDGDGTHARADSPARPAAPEA